MAARSYGRRTIEIGERRVGPGEPVYVIAEAGANHDRDLDTALRLIEVAAEAGADAVKFQTYTAEGLYSRFTPTMSYLEEDGLLSTGERVWDLIKRIELPWEWHGLLADRARALGIDFLSTPFEEAAVDALEEVGVPAYKIASYEITHLPLIRRCAATGRPLLLSTGMASLGDIERALDVVAEVGNDQSLLMHCAINYPPRFEDLNLRAITTLAGAFRVPTGWSDHTMGHTADVVATALGVSAIEKHFTLDRGRAGPDHPFALEPNELADMVRAIREAESSLGSSVKRVTPAEYEMFRLGRRSLVAASDLPAGTVLQRDHVAIKRPGTGIPVHDLDIVIGHRTMREIPEDEPLVWEAFRDGPA
jgi:sialic acid synthase SpsE